MGIGINGLDPPDAHMCRDHRGHIRAAVNDFLHRICGGLSIQRIQSSLEPS